MKSISLPVHGPFAGRWLLAALLLLSGATLVRSAEVLVFAAASLTDALKETAALYQKNRADRVLFNFAASSLLARQIIEGAPADIFFSADEAKMDALEKRGLILPGTRKSRLSNSLVIVTSTKSTVELHSPADLAGKDILRIALADPQAVPAGIYSKLYLEKARLWPEVSRKIVPTDNVRSALAAVESGNADAGIVFKTDAAISRRVKIAYEVPRADSPSISYSVALIRDSNQVEAARKFVQYLESDEAGRIFEKYGFVTFK